MAPISEKRPTIIKENTKENMLTTKNTTNSRSGGIEILDFRDSWLQEIEMYKDQVRAQQLLTAHNHLHTLDGYHKEFREGTAKRRARTKSDSDTIDVKSRHDDEVFQFIKFIWHNHFLFSVYIYAYIYIYLYTYLCLLCVCVLILNILNCC